MTAPVSVHLGSSALTLLRILCPTSVIMLMVETKYHPTLPTPTSSSSSPLPSRPTRSSLTCTPASPKPSTPSSLPTSTPPLQRVTRHPSRSHHTHLLLHVARPTAASNTQLHHRLCVHAGLPAAAAVHSASPHPPPPCHCHPHHPHHHVLPVAHPAALRCAARPQLVAGAVPLSTRRWCSRRWAGWKHASATTNV